MLPTLIENPSRTRGRFSPIEFRCGVCHAEPGAECNRARGGFHTRRQDKAIRAHWKVRDEFRCPGCHSEWFYESADCWLFCSECDGAGRMLDDDEHFRWRDVLRGLSVSA